VALAILVFSNAWMRNLMWPGVALGLLVISAVAIGGIYPAAVQGFAVRPSPLLKEAKYIQRSIDATRQAYGLTDTQVIPYPATTTVPPADLGNDTTTVPNIRLLDPAKVNDTYTQLQQVRGFYDFGDKLNIDRYSIDNHLQDYVVGAREINYDRLTAQQSNWQNKHTTFTHGFGFVAAPANKVVCDGQPYFVSGFLSEHPEQANKSASGEACSASSDLIGTDQPRIYYGERASEYAITGSTDPKRQAEFDRPSATGDQYYTYTGKGGVEVGSFGRRLLYSLHYRETNFLLSNVFNDSSKLLYIREPRARVEKVAPFLTIDGDPYPAVVNKRIVWILDGYTTASTYPYAQRINLKNATNDALTGAGTFSLPGEEINYLRNSVKATVDAYDGTVTLYAFDESDPVLKAWNKAFGGKLIQPRSAISPELMQHFRYPEDQFKVQRDLLSKFHVTDPSGFFNQAGFWDVPVDPTQEHTGPKQPPYYLLAKFPGQNESAFQLTAAVTPRNRQNLAALMYASYDTSGKPRLQVLQLPNDTLIAGPIQVHQKMQNSPDVRRDITLFGSSQSNSKVEYGNLLTLPVGGGMLYVEPLYIQSKEANSYPLMKKVLLNYGEFVAYEDTLQKGVQSLVQQATGQSPTIQPPPPPPSSPGGGQAPSSVLADAVAQINKALADLKAAQQAGDFEGQGRALKELDDAVKAFNEAQKAAGTPASPAPTTAPSGAGTPSPAASG
jgi:uncharacterized membrane protein (UPF0182 family)